MIDALYKAGLADLTDVVLSHDDTSKRVLVKCGRRVVVKLRRDIARMFGFLNDTTIRASDEKSFTLALPETGNRYFYIYTDIIKSQSEGGGDFSFVCTGVCGHRIGKLTHPQTKARPNTPILRLFTTEIY